VNLESIGINPAWEQPLQTVFTKYDVSTNLRQAAFIGQCAFESNNFRVLQENLNYSAEGLMAMWPSRFQTQEEADAYAHNPQKIANKVYGGRMGNSEDGDGWNYHGRGLIMITGRDAYQNVGNALSLDLISSPDLLLDPMNAAMSAGWFWNKKNLNSLADSKDYTEMTKRINGGTSHLGERIIKIQAALAMLQG
jgi:putative chitinase